MNIPKDIHLCWFGRGKYPELTEMCINSWKSVLSDYKIVLWNEDNYDVYRNTFTKRAYQERKWAFVSDYARLEILYEHGGVYMDTDVEVIKDFTELLENKHYLSSFVEGGLITCGFIATEPKHPFLKAILDYYDEKYKTPNIPLIMNPLIFTKIAEKRYGFKLGEKFFRNSEIEILPMTYFMPFRKNMFGGIDKYAHCKYYITETTYTIHHDMGSWAKKKKYKRLITNLVRLITPELVYLLFKKKKSEILLRKLSD